MSELTETIRIRVSAPDRRAMEAAAKRAKLNLSAWARMILSHYARGAEIATAVEDNMKAVGFPRRPSLPCIQTGMTISGQSTDGTPFEGVIVRVGSDDNGHCSRG